MRSVRTKDFKYIRNFLPNRPYLQPCAYKDEKAILIALRAAQKAGQLDDVQQLILREVRPVEELYDVRSDPYEVHNLATDAELAQRPELAKELSEMRERLDIWMEETGDQGRVPESEEMYDSDMAVYTQRLADPKFDPAQLEQLLENIALMKHWAAEGN
ncbi:MAG: hypothetical protein R3C56_19930 [Pirellulaceae bacterium]